MSFKSLGAVTDSASHVGTSPFTVAVPAGVSDGDLMIMIANRGADGLYTTPAGWTQVPALQKSSSAFKSYSSLVAYKVANSEPASYDITHTNATGKAQSAAIIAYDPVDAAIFDVTPVVAHSLQQYDSNTPTVPDITTVTDGALLLALQWVSNAEITNAAGPSGFTMRLDHTPFTDRNILIADKVQAIAGAVSPGAWLHTTGAQFGDGATAILALRPAEENQDPVLDSPESDYSEAYGWTGTIDVGGNFSDANPGDTLTFSDDNNFAANEGVTFNSATGVFTLDGTLAQGTYNVAVTASDGNGGTYPQDTFTVEITAPVLIVNSVSDTAPQPGDQIDITHSNALDDLTAGDYTVVSNSPGTTRVLVPNPITFVLTGQTYPTINFNTPVNIPLTDGTNSDDAALDGIEPPTGTEFAEITSIPANSIYAATPAIQVGHFGHFFNITGNWVIDPATGVVIVDAAGGSFEYTVYNGEWAAPVTHTVAARPSGTVTIDSLVPGRNGALVNFSYAGADLTGFQYRIDGGSWVAATSPLNITGQTATTEYTLDLVAVNNGRQGDITTVIYSTTDAVDTTPNPFSIAPLTGQALSSPAVFAPVTVQGVDAGADVPVSITGGTYSVSTDGGTTWGAQTSSATNVRLNYQIRVHHTTAATHATQTQTTLTVGGVSATATSTTLADAVAPVITLTGGNQTLTEGDTWSEPGYSATDNADGNLTGQVQVTGLVNTAVPGLYVLSYSVQDAAGNSTTVTRNVTVQALVNPEGITVDTPSTRIIFAGTSSNFWPTFMQDSSDVLDYLIDFGALLQTDTIQSLSIRNTSMTITKQLFEGQKVQLWCKGGREGETAEITVKIVSLAGRTIERSFMIRIGEY